MDIVKGFIEKKDVPQDHVLIYTVGNVGDEIYEISLTLHQEEIGIDSVIHNVMQDVQEICLKDGLVDCVTMVVKEDRNVLTFSTDDDWVKEIRSKSL